MARTKVKKLTADLDAVQYHDAPGLPYGAPRAGTSRTCAQVRPCCTM